MWFTIDDLEIWNKYLQRFGNPECYILKSEDENWWITPDWQRLARKFHSKKYPLKEVMKLNRDYPLWVHVTLNWNFWDNNIKTWKLLLRKVWNEWKKPYWNAMVADFDMKDCDKFWKWWDLEKYWDYLFENYIEVEWLPMPDYIHKSWWWRHVIWRIPDKERVKISKFLTDKQVSNAFMFIQTVVYWGAELQPQWSWRWKIETVTWIDVWRSRFSTSASIRMPLTNHRKTGSPIQWKLYQLYREKATIFRREIIHASDILIKDELWELTYDLIKSWSDKYDEATKAKKDFKKIVMKNSWFDKSVIEKVNEIKFPEIFDKLAWYRMSYWGRHYWLSLDMSTKSVVIEYEDWTRHTPSWRKYWEETNRIKEFNSSKTMDERPWWTASEFLYRFFSRNWKLVDEFLKKEFWLTLIVWSDQELWVFWHTTVWDNDIICLPTKIIIKKIVTTGSWNSVPKITDLFHQPFTVIWKWFTSFSTGQWETLDEEQVFIIKKYGSDEKQLLKCYPTKRLWNQDNIWKWLFFYWDDNDLWLFYDWIFNDPNIPEYDIVARNWYFDWYYVFWWETFPQEEHKPLFNICKQKWFSFEINKWTQISLKEYITKGKKVRDEKIFVPAFLQAIALAWTNIWDRVDSFNQFPWLLLTWYTGSWKTVLHETISLAFWYWRKSRTMSISRTSPQPLKQAGIDWSILHLEEFTDPIKPASEDILRDILNRSLSSRWTPWKNIVWQYRSTPFVDWESMPQSESVANRFVIIPVDKKYWKWTTNSIHELQEFAVSEELYSKRYDLWKDPDKLYETINKWVNFLTSEDINPRAANVRATVFTVNELFDINFSETKLLKYAKELMKDVWIDQWDKQRLTPFMRFRIFLAEAVMQRNVTISEQVYWNHTTISFIFQKEFITKNIANISKLINEINWQTMLWLQENHRDLSEFKPLVFLSPMLSMPISDINVTPTDTALWDLRDRYIRHLPKWVYTYYDWTHEPATINF